VSPQIAIEAAQLRANWGYKTPDAIQLATAQAGNATFFVTNDGGLASTSGLQVVVLKHLLPQP
jgi:predicted nucleic acid-binding protein